MYTVVRKLVKTYFSIRHLLLFSLQIKLAGGWRLAGWLADWLAGWLAGWLAMYCCKNQEVSNGLLFNKAITAFLFTNRDGWLAYWRLAGGWLAADRRLAGDWLAGFKNIWKFS